jgi:hypothetical protein
MSSPLKSIVRQLRLSLRSDEIKIEIDEELQFHIDMRTQDNSEAGMTPEEARTSALRQFGDYEKVKQACYAAGERRSLNEVGIISIVPLLMTFFGLMFLIWTMSHPYNNLGGVLSMLFAVSLTFISFISIPLFFQPKPIKQNEPILGLVDEGESSSPTRFFNEGGKSPLERVLEDR